MSRLEPRPLRKVAVPPALLVACLFALPPTTASAPPAAAQEEFSDRQRVTAVDLLVETRRRLEPAGLTVEVDGTPHPVVAVEADGRSEAWHLVVYFDLPLAEPAAVRWAADALGARAETLTDLGAVEIVVAAPEPRPVLRATRDPRLVELALTQIAGAPGGSDELVRLRRGVGAELAADEPALPARELTRRAAEEENRFVRERGDALLLHLLESSRRPAAGARKALLWVTSGWDADPAVFYNARLQDTASSKPPRGAAAAASAHEAAHGPDETLAPALAAYGWTTLVLVPPVPTQPAWHLRRRAQVAIDRMHKPKLGEALRELAAQRAKQGDLEGAADALRGAIHAFYDHPASAERQALAEAELADVLQRLGREESAARLLRRAVERSPELAYRFPGAAAALVDPLTPLSALAEATAGRVVREIEAEPGALDAALASLERRVRITYQMTGPPDGRVRPVELRRQGGGRLTAPGWSRSGTPERIAEARLRRLVAGDPLPDPASGAGAPVASWRLELDAASGRWVLPPDTYRPEAVYRLSSLARNGRIEHRVTPSSPEDSPHPWRQPYDPDARAILLEDLSTGSWDWKLLAQTTEPTAGGDATPGLTPATGASPRR